MKTSFDLHLLLPSEHLPAEGLELTPAAEFGTETEALRWLLRQLPEPVAAFEVTRDAVRFSQESLTLKHMCLKYVRGEADGPWLEASGAAAELNLGEFSEWAQAADVAADSPTELGLRRLLAALRQASEGPLSGFRGFAMPLLEWFPDKENPDSGHAIFHGFWLVETDSLLHLSTWHGDEDAPGLIFQSSDVEAHGLKEMALVLLLGLVIGNQPAEAGDAPQRERGGLISAIKGLFSSDEKEEAAKATAKPAAKTASKPAATSQRGKKTASTPVKVTKQPPAVINKDLLAASCAENVEVVVDIGRQRAYLLVDGKIALETPISSAAKGSWTPRGTFTITQRVRTGKISTIYKCPLPYWMRLGETAIGMHVGEIPGYPASHGCVRLPADIAPVMFDHTYKGTKVKVVDSWTPKIEAGQAIAAVP